MKDFLAIAAFFALAFLIMYFHDHDYKNVKQLYYECSDAKEKLIPLTPYQYKTLKDSDSIGDYTCSKKQYTQYYVNILKEKRK